MEKFTKTKTGGAMSDADKQVTNASTVQCQTEESEEKDYQRMSQANGDHAQKAFPGSMEKPSKMTLPSRRGGKA